MLQTLENKWPSFLKLKNIISAEFAIVLFLEETVLVVAIKISKCIVQ